MVAAHRHTSHVEPSAAVTRPATVPNPVGTTPAVVGAGAVVTDAVVTDEVGAGALVVAALDGAAVTTGAAVVATDAAGNRSAASSSPHAATATSSTAAVRSRHDTPITVGVSVDRVPVTSTCESCGAEEHELYAVHRQYVTPAEWDTPGREVTLDEVERWCYSCLTHYPHVLVEG